MVSEPTVEDTIAILRGLKERYEVYHGVKIQDGAIIAAATLSNRYITDRFLPDKAIDLIDEACAMIRTEIDSMPTELDVIQRKIIQHEIEEAALKKEDDALSREHLAEIQKELAEMRDEFNAKKAQWENEKNAIGKVQKLREELESANAELEAAQRQYDLNRAAELQYGRIPELRKQLEAEEAIANEGKARSLLRDKVTEEEIARIIERWTGGTPPNRGREGKAAPPGGHPPPAGGGPGRGCAPGERGYSPLPGGHRRSRPSHRLLPVPGPHRRGQDRAGQGPGRGPVRQREEPGAHRHERVYGEVLRLPPHRRASRIRGL